MYPQLTDFQISFTFILPLFPSLLDFYRSLDPPSENPKSLLNLIIHNLNAYKNAFARPIDSRYDIVLLGGALGSLFSFLQAVASPVIGRLSDKYGRRKALLWSMTGNIASVALWVAATDFRTFLASRIVGGLSEGNIQLATAIATDISTEEQRGSTMALVGACFSIAFTFGPALGAALANVTTVAANPFATAAGFSLFLIVTETLYLYLYLPETHSPKSSKPITNSTTKSSPKPAPQIRTNSLPLLNFIHLSFLLPFSGMEFSLPFLTYSLLSYSSAQNGRLLGYIGLIASILQGSLVRRLPPLLVVRIGVVAATIAFFLLSRIQTQLGLYTAGTALAITSATVVTGLNSLGSFEAGSGTKGEVLGALRSWGQLGRSMGPLVFCTLYWWAGREVAYMAGGTFMIGVCGMVFLGLKSPKMGGKT
jgi:MFS family permease